MENNPSKEKYNLVTGASGLLGTELISILLKEGKKVKAVFNKTPLKTFEDVNLQVVQCDLLDVITLEEIMHDVEFVYHCAGLISYSSRNKSSLYKSNLDVTANVVNAALHAGVSKMVHVSSIAALGKFIEGKHIDETMEWTEDAKNSIYGHSKYLGELEVWRGIAEGLNAVIINPSIILGPGNWNDGSTAIFKNVYNGFKWYTEGVNGFVDVRDVADSMVMLMESEISAERFIISAENKIYKDVFCGIADAFNKERPSRKITRSMVEIVWRLEKLKSIFTKTEPLVTRETANTALASVHFDNSKLIKFLPNFKYRLMTDTISHTCMILQQKVNIE